jgi:hypothetical protein
MNSHFTIAKHKVDGSKPFTRSRNPHKLGALLPSSKPEGPGRWDREARFICGTPH